MAYVTAIVMQFTSGSSEVSIKARGPAISAAVDIVEVCRRRFFEGKLHVKDTPSQPRGWAFVASGSGFNSLAN
jgi:DNA-binding protein Alba